MFDKKTVDLYKKLFGNISIIKADFNANAGTTTYVRDGARKVKAKCISEVKNGSECVVFRDEQNQLFLISDATTQPESLIRNIAYRKTTSKRTKESFEAALLYAAPVPGSIVSLNSIIRSKATPNQPGICVTGYKGVFGFLLPIEINDFQTYQSLSSIYEGSADNAIARIFGISFNIPDGYDRGYKVESGIEYTPARGEGVGPLWGGHYSSPTPFQSVFGEAGLVQYVLGDDTCPPTISYTSTRQEFNPLVDSIGNFTLARDYYLFIDGQSIFIDRIHADFLDTTTGWISSTDDEIFIHLKSFSALNYQALINPEENVFNAYYRNRFYTYKNSAIVKEFRDNVSKEGLEPVMSFDGTLRPVWRQLTPTAFPLNNDWREIENQYTRNESQIEGTISGTDRFSNIINNKFYRFTPESRNLMQIISNIQDGVKLTFTINNIDGISYSLQSTKSTVTKPLELEYPQDSFLLDACIIGN